MPTDNPSLDGASEVAEFVDLLKKVKETRPRFHFELREFYPVGSVGADGTSSQSHSNEEIRVMEEREEAKWKEHHLEDAKLAVTHKEQQGEVAKRAARLALEAKARGLTWDPVMRFTVTWDFGEDYKNAQTQAAMLAAMWERKSDAFSIAEAPPFPWPVDYLKGTPVNPMVVGAVRKCIADWDGKNWSAVYQYLRNCGRSVDELASMTMHDVHMAFATGQQPMLRISGKATTATNTIQRFGGADDSAALDEIDVDILTAISKQQHAMKLYDVAAAAGYSEKTCGEHLARLIELGYSVRKSERSGVSITDAGRDRLKQPPTPTS